MNDHPSQFAELGKRSLFLVWGPPSLGPRSRVFSRELGIEALHFVYLETKRGLITTPARYFYQGIQTLRLLFHIGPKIVFVQSPPSLAVMFVYLYCMLTGSQYLIDAHSAAFLLPIWTYPGWLHRYIARRAVATIVTNNHFRKIVESWGGAAFVLRDIPTDFPEAVPPILSKKFNIAVINTFSPDEPLDQIIDAAIALEKVHFYITGKKSNAPANILAAAPDNVHFTDFLPDECYYALLRSSDAVMCLTTRDHTMQRGACEALSLGKPIIVSDWPILRNYFQKGTVYVANTKEAIFQGVCEMKKHHFIYQREIKELQKSQQEEWARKIVVLTDLVRKAVETG